MDLKRIEDLLAKYYEGETTIEEEEELRTFFSGDSVPGHLKNEQVAFRFFSEAKDDAIEGKFDERLVRKLAISSPKMGMRKTMTLRLASGIAAGIILAVGLKFYFGPRGGNSSSVANDVRITQPPSRPAPDRNTLIAYAQAKEALLKISGSLNKGNSEVTRISKISEIESIVTKKK